MRAVRGQFLVDAALNTLLYVAVLQAPTYPTDRMHKW